MDTGIAAHFDQLISLARAHLTDAEVVRRDVTSRRAILNHADLSAIRLCYGADWKQHRYEPIPHLHLENKTKLELTEEMTCQQFLAWMEVNLCPAPT